jgi:Arc/MetJ family transcription regulator
MRTTISVDDNLLRAAKRRARGLGLTLGQFVEAALRRELSRSGKDTGRPEIPVYSQGTGLRPGVDASSTRTLLEALDRDRPLEELR